MPKVFAGPAAVKEAVGQHLGYTDWMVIDQDRINRFADATGDHQWIHVDEEKAKEGPFGATIAHGYLTLSLTNLFLPQLITVENISMGINYGVNKVRFPQPLLVGSRVRLRVVLAEVTDLASGTQVVLRHTIEIEGASKPACVAETVVLLLPEA